MAIVESVKVRGLWGYRNFSLRFDKHINFLIGPNGSGKTAVINLIAGALRADELLLERETFESVEVTLQARSDQIRKVKVSKAPNLIGGEDILFAIDDETPVSPRSRGQSLFRRPVVNSDLQDRLTSSIPTTWLTLDRRAHVAGNRMADPARQVPIDIRLADLSERLTRYFSELQTKAEQETQDFIRSVFANLLPPNVDAAQKAERSTLSIEIDSAALKQIFENFGILNQRNEAKIDQFGVELQRISELLKLGPREAAKKFEPKDLALLSTAAIITPVVARWQKVSAEKDKIYAERDLFLAISRRLFKGKEIRISNENELEIDAAGGAHKPLRMVDLSSGEKQMVVLLGEALLQRKSPQAYIADEPELSLHIQWQESLVDVLSEINPNAQIIFATHSPDIIGRRTKNAIDMSKVGEDVPK